MEQEVPRTEVWLTVKQVVDILGASSEAVIKRVQRGGYTVKKARGGGGPGGKRTLIALSSLPPEAQVKYLRSKSEPAGLVPGVGASRGAVNLSELPDSYAERAQRKLRIVREVLSLERDGDVTGRVKELARREGTSLPTIYRWVKIYRESGLDPLSLVPGKPRKGYVSFDQEAAEYLLGLYCRPQQPKVWECYCLTKKKAKEKRWKVGSYATACRIVEDYDNAVKTLGRQGKTAFRDRFEPKILRDFSDLRVNETWVGDHTALNIIVKTDPVAWAPRGTSRREYARPWITMFEDLRTRMITGFQLSLMPSSQTIALCLRHAILAKQMTLCDMKVLMEKIGVDLLVRFTQFTEWEWPVMGMPDETYIDNGKDFRAKRFEGGSDRFGKIDYAARHVPMLEEMCITPRHTTPYLARSKPIESFFRPLKEFIGTLPGGWQGKNPRQTDKAKVEKDKKEGLILTMDELRVLIEMWIVFQYHRLPHRGKGMNGNCPLEVWMEERKNTPLRTVSKRALDFLLMKVDKRAVSDKGIRIFNEFYESLDLMRLIGKTVEVRYDPADISRIHVFCAGQYVCTAESVRYSSMHPSEEDYKEKLRRQRQSRKRVEEEVERLQEAARYPDPLERIAAVKEERGREIKRSLHEERPGEVISPTRFDSVPEPGSLDASDEVMEKRELLLRDFHEKQVEKDQKGEPKKKLFLWDWQKKASEEEPDERSGL